MHSLIIVDDENWIIESLKVGVQWEKYDFEVIGQANDGIEAFDLIMDRKPDVVITDIRMPGMNGLELMKKVNDSSINPLFIIISGYAEFAYAQKAMNYGAVGYVLKPFDDNDVVKLIEKARQTLTKNAVSLDIKIMDLLESNEPVSGTEMKIVFKEMGLEWDENKTIYILAALGSGNLELPERIKAIKLRMSLNKKIYLLSCDEQTMDMILQGKIPEGISGIGLTTALYDFNDIKRAIEESITAAYQFFMTGKKSFFMNVHENQEVINECLINLDRAVRKKDIKLINETFDALSALFKENTYSIKYALRIYNIVMLMVYASDKSDNEDFLYKFEQITELFKDVQLLISYLKETSISQVISEPELHLENIGNEKIKTILQYVNENFNKNISIQTITQKFYINPCYVSQLFRKEVGKTFTDYLSALRIGYACDMLKSSTLSIQEIAEKAGYNGYFYFCRSFKKATLKTPSQYREEMS